MNAISADDWYQTLTSEKDLQQGDLFLNIETVFVAGSEDLSDKGGLFSTRQNLVILTQTCDIENKALPFLLCADFIFKSEARQENANLYGEKTSSFRQMLQGIHPSIIMLPKDISLPEPLLRESIFVSFDNLVLIERNNLITQMSTPRLRLKPPYREHFSQQFARHLMRVALEKPLSSLEEFRK